MGAGTVIAMNLSNAAQVYCNVILIWIGFGTVVAFLSHLLVPVGDASEIDVKQNVVANKFRGFGTSLLCGMIGSCLGPLAVTVLWHPTHFNPISPAGLVISMIPAILLLLWLRWKSRL